MKILHRYIFHEISTYFLSSLVVFTGMLLTIRLLKFAGLIINKGVAVKQIATVFVSIIPTFLEFAIPMAALLGVMLAFARLSGDSEVMVIRTSGIGLSEMIAPVVFFGAVVSVLGLFVSVYLRPWGHQCLSETLFEIARTRSSSGMTAGIFNRLGNLTLFAEKIDHRTGALTGVLVDDRRQDSNRRIITAESGKILSSEKAQTITILLASGSIHEQVDGKYVLTDFTTNDLSLAAEDLYDREAGQRDRKVREMRLDELSASLRYISGLLSGDDKSPATIGLSDVGAYAELSPEKLRKRLVTLQLERGRRFSMPLASLILALVAVPLGIQQPRLQRNWGAGLSVALGVIVFVLYYALLSIGITLAEGAALHPYASLWIPNLGIAVIAAVLLKKLFTEEWYGITEAAEAFLETALGRVARRGAFR